MLFELSTGIGWRSFIVRGMKGCHITDITRSRHASSLNNIYALLVVIHVHTHFRLQIYVDFLKTTRKNVLFFPTCILIFSTCILNYLVMQNYLFEFLIK